MKIIRLNTRGVTGATADKVEGNQGDYYAVQHGEQGRGRWMVRYPLAAREFPSPVDAGPTLDIGTEHFKLIDLKRDDKRGNRQQLLARGEEDGLIMVLWSLSPGYRGGASYRYEGDVAEIAKGEEAQGMAGRMGSAACPVLLVAGPCQLNWTRTGRLYSSKADWVVVYDGNTWTVSPADEHSLESAVFNY